MIFNQYAIKNGFKKNKNGGIYRHSCSYDITKKLNVIDTYLSLRISGKVTSRKLAEVAKVSEKYARKIIKEYHTSEILGVDIQYFDIKEIMVKK